MEPIGAIGRCCGATTQQWHDLQGNGLMLEILSTALFGNWESVLRIVVSALVMYPIIILSIRLSGKRSTSQMNGFDWIVTVALGSITGSAILLKNVPIVDALTASSVLLLMQWSLTKGTRHSQTIADIVKSEPRMLFSEGEFLDRALSDERVHKSEIIAAIRTAGYASLSQIKWVILETDAKLSIIPKTPKSTSDDTAVEKVVGYSVRNAREAA